MPKVPDPLGYIANQVQGTRDAVCPGCKTYRCGSKTSYRTHTQQCAWFLELKQAQEAEAQQDATQRAWTKETFEGKPTYPFSDHVW